MGWYFTHLIMADTEQVRSKVAAELRPFGDISKSLKHLVSQHHFDDLVEVLSRIYKAEAGHDRLRSSVVKEHLKVIVPCMINEIWGQDTPQGRNSTKTLKKPIRKSPSPERTAVAERSIGSQSGITRSREGLERRRSSPTALLRESSPNRLFRESSEGNFSRTLGRLSYQEAHSLSEFCNIKGAVSFNTAKRPLTSGNQRSPGPAAYRADKGKLKPNSPRAVIPQGGKKGELFNPPYSPGPAAYYVMRHFVSKPS